MLREISWADDRAYRTGQDHEPIQFYLNALSNSSRFDLLLGYFSSAAINVLSLGFAQFLCRGGTVRIIINNLLSPQDKEAIEKGQCGHHSNILFDLRDIQTLKNSLEQYGKHFFECLAWLISNKKIEIKIIKPKEGRGISHYKSGVFTDGNDKIGFTASCNFTAFGLLENLEELHCHLSWENGVSNKALSGQISYFENIFSGKADFFEYVDIKDIEVAIKTEFGDKDINDLLIQEKDLLEKKKKLTSNKKLKEIINAAEKEIEIIAYQPRFPFTEGPRPYQLEAYKKWINNNYQGIFAMATGTGKTVTSLNCILEEYKLNKYYRFLVLVPTIALANQWYDEVNNKFNFEQVVVCSSSTNWEASIREYGRSIKLGNEPDFSIITTYASFRGKLFQRLFYELFEKELPNITLIADEAHTLGSSGFLKILPTRIDKRIGLSATPERQYDELGGNAIYDFFNSYPPKFTFQYNMKKAIEDKVLSEYRYFPMLIELLPEELIEYKKITRQLTKYLQPDGKYQDNPAVQMLLIKRKRIVHKAKNKNKCLIDIIEEIRPSNFKYAFVYVPEGFESDYGESDEDNIDDEDNSIIDEYTKLLYNKYNFSLRKFTGETKDREQILKQFAEGKLDALLAMKCLDEGVDVPRTTIAVFCSSTGNPRQYIQRRGRVLRFYEKKTHADIYDMIIKPSFDATETDPKQLKLETNIFMGELQRLINFAVLANNKDECLAQIEPLCYSLNIDPYELANNEEKKYDV
jgi:superfamily II DNA or RNA helicase